MVRCERLNPNDTLNNLGKCVANKQPRTIGNKHPACQNKKIEFKAEKRKIGLNYKKFLIATKKLEQLSRKLKKSSAVITQLKSAMVKECKNGESGDFPHRCLGCVCDCIGYSIGSIPYKRSFLFRKG